MEIDHVWAPLIGYDSIEDIRNCGPMYRDYCDSKAWLLRSTILQLSRRVARITSSGYYRQRAHHYIILSHIDTSSAEIHVSIDMGSIPCFCRNDKTALVCKT